MKVLAAIVSIKLLTACSTTMVTTTTEKPDGEVVTVKEFKTSRNDNVMRALRTSLTAIALARLDGGSSFVLSSYVQLKNHQEEMKFNREKFEYEKEKLVTQHVANTI